MHRLVFLHYLGGSAGEWRGVIDALPCGFDCLTIDLPGFGRHAETGGYDVTSMTDHVVEALGSDHRGPWTLVGHSMGAKVAAAVARRALDGTPGLEGLAALVLVAGSPPSPEPMTDDKRSEMLGWFNGDDAQSRREAERFVDSNVHSPLGDATRDRAIADVLQTHKDAWRAWLTDGSREDWRDRIGTVDLPTLLVAGSADEALGAEAQLRETAPHFPDGRVEVVEGAGHLIPLEHPERLATLIAEHVAGVDALLPEAFGRLLRSRLVSSGTRSVLLARLLPGSSDGGILPDDLLLTLRAALARLVPQRSAQPVDLAAGFVASLDGEGDGWRYATLPDDRTAAVRGLRTLDAAARAQGAAAFAQLAPADQDALLAAAMEGGPTTPGADLLDGDQMRLWMEDLRAAATRVYVAHPSTLARLGYSGIANGGDGSPKIPWRLIREGDRESWEPEPAR